MPGIEFEPDEFKGEGEPTLSASTPSLGGVEPTAEEMEEEERVAAKKARRRRLMKVWSLKPHES